MVLDSKLQVLSKIKSLRSLLSDFPNIENGYSNFQSVNGNENILTFLIDILKSLVGWDTIKKCTINFLVQQLTPIEVAIKFLMKELLRKYFFCNLDAIIPTNLICDGTATKGINIPLNSIDFFHLFKIDPQSDTGIMLYGNPQLDFNAFLYNVIQGNATNWQDIVEITFHEQGQIVDGVPTNNVFRVCVHPNYQGQTVHKLIDDFIDSIPLLQIELLISRIFDGIFGTLSFYAENCFERLKAEEEFNILVEHLLDFPDTEIDNSFFEFSNPQKSQIRENITNRSRGIAHLKDCCLDTQKVDFADLSDLIKDLKVTSTEIEQRELLNNKFNILIEDSLKNLDDQDKEYNIFAFYENFFKGIIKGILNILFSPKMMFMFAFYFQIVNGTIGFTNMRDFMRQHSKFFKDIINNVIMPLILKFIFELIVRELKKLMAAEIAERVKEKARLFRLQIESLLPFKLPNLGLDIF